MSKLQEFREFVNQRLATVSLQILGQYEKSLAEYQEEICHYKEKNDQLQRMLDIQSVIQLHHPEMEVNSATVPVPATEEFTVKRKRRRPPKTTPPPKPASPDKIGKASFRHTAAIFQSEKELEKEEVTVMQEEEAEEDEATDLSEEEELEEDEATGVKEEGEPGMEVDPAPATMPLTITEVFTIKRKRGRPPKPTPPPKPASRDRTGGASSRHDVQHLSLPEPLQIKEEQDLWTSQEVEQLQALHPGTDSIFTSPGVKTSCDPEGSSQLPPLDQTPNVYSGGDYLPTSKTEVQVKAEPDEEECGAPEPARDIQPSLLAPGWPAAQSVEEEKVELEGGILSEQPAYSPRVLPPRKTTQAGHQCRICGKVFTFKSGLVIHRRIHTGEKPYQCQECDQAFTQKSSLSTHRRIHTKEKPYLCEECDKAFRHQSSLAKHKKIHTGEKPYQCEDCNQTFNRKDNLISHRKSHTTEKPYQCQECDRSFQNKGNFVKHGRTHTGEKPYRCNECGQAFSRKDALVEHQRIHTGEKPYHCEECGRAFRRRGTLMTHRQVHMGKKLYP